MIRLGSLAGYPFEGPRVLAGWTPPHAAAVYAITYKPDPAKEQHAVIYVGHADNLSAERFPFRHPRSPAWIKRAGSKWNLYISVYEVPGGTASHREQITRELIATYHPGCNTEQYDNAWKDTWLLPPAPPAGTLWWRLRCYHSANHEHKAQDPRGCPAAEVIGRRAGRGPVRSCRQPATGTRQVVPCPRARTAAAGR